MTVSIGIAGTAKNTGKTTTVLALLSAAYQERLTVGLTSIGYDGEAIDHVTGLAKPRVYCRRGTWLATATGALPEGTARVAIETRTGIGTALGEIIIGRVTRPGLVALVGPNTGRALNRTVEVLAAMGCRLVLVDGALNRLAPLAETGSLILATGAARNTDIGALVRETASIERLLGLPAWPHSGESMPARNCRTASLLTAEAVRAVAADSAVQGGAGATLVVQGAVSLPAMRELSRLVASRRLALAGVMFADATKLLVGGNPVEMSAALTALESRGVRLYLGRCLPLVAVTVNPFYPAPVPGASGQEYCPAEVDAGQLLTEMSGALRVPVFDVLRPGDGVGLFDLVAALASSRRGMPP